MRYRNIITGAEFETKSTCSAPNYVLVGAETTLKIENTQEPQKAPEDPPQDEGKPQKKAAPKKTATKKRTKK